MDRISAFMDGETSQLEAHQAIIHLKQNDQCCETWKIFHLIGDVMRGDPVLRDDFTARICSCLQQEPTALAPRFRWRKTTRFALSAAASLAAVAVVLALVLTDNPLKLQSAPVAVAPKPEAQMAAAQPQPVPAAHQRRVNEYLMAHQGFSPSTTLQGLVLYARTVQPAPDGSGQ